MESATASTSIAPSEGSATFIPAFLANTIPACTEGASLNGAHLEEANLERAHLEGASLNGAHLEGAYLHSAHLERAKLGDAHLERAFLRDAQLERAFLNNAHLEEANLTSAHLEGANLSYARLKGANLTGAHLEGASLNGAQLEGANLSHAHLEEAFLNGATFDNATRLNDAVVTGAQLDQATFDNTNLSVVDWRAVPWLGDELKAREAKAELGRRKGDSRRLFEYRTAVRANRRLAVALQANGLSEDAARYNYRAQLCQRKAYFYERRIPSWLGSWLLAALAGYGFRPLRTILWYFSVLIAFAALYVSLGTVNGHPFNVVEAAVFSVTSFHGRGFFPGSLALDNPVTVVAALEAVLGLLIEISFIATFTQRFFNSR